MKSAEGRGAVRLGYDCPSPFPPLRGGPLPSPRKRGEGD